jgi:hypothetical protein
MDDHYDEKQQQVAPDPGPQPRTSTPLTAAALVRAVLIVLGALVALLVALVAGKLSLQFADKLKPPHLALYQNKTWDQVTNRSAVVRPLISGDDRFDIIATIWLRGNASQQTTYRAERYPDGDPEEVEDVNENHMHREIPMSNLQFKMYSDEGLRPTRVQDDVFEDVLYSGIIIPNATLSEKGLVAEVSLEFPVGVL